MANPNIDIFFDEIEDMQDEETFCTSELESSIAEEKLNAIPIDGYAVDLTKIEFNRSAGYIKGQFEIREGEQIGFFQNVGDTKFPPNVFFVGTTPESKERRLQFITAVRDSNPGFPDQWKPSDLVGKQVGVVLRNEEYYDRYNDEIKVRVGVARFTTVDKIRAGYYEKFDPKDIKRYYRKK